MAAHALAVRSDLGWLPHARSRQGGRRGIQDVGLERRRRLVHDGSGMTDRVTLLPPASFRTGAHPGEPEARRRAPSWLHSREERQGVPLDKARDAPLMVAIRQRLEAAGVAQPRRTPDGAEPDVTPKR
jgi:hypothetical protein